MDLINHYTCTCADGYTGVHCESGELLLVADPMLTCLMSSNFSGQSVTAALTGKRVQAFEICCLANQSNRLSR